MTPYKDKQEFVKILSALWDRIFSTPEVMERLSGEKIIVKFRYTDFDTSLFIDNSGETPTYYWDPEGDVPFDVEMIQSSETSHKFWMEDLNVPLAIATRKVIAKGSVQRALKLLPALKPAFKIYPQILREMGRDDLLQKAGAKKRKRRTLRWFKRKKAGAYDLSKLQPFPLRFIDEERMPETTLQDQPWSADPIELLRTMYTIRAFEEHLAKALKEGQIPTEAIHLSIGQEAVAAGVCLNLRPTDYLNTTHRGHGHIIAKGADLGRMMAEIYDKATGLCKGKGGSMHVTDRSIGVLGANGIVEAGYLLGLGAGFAIKHHEKSDNISVVFAGDGSVNQGMFHEAMNMIALMRLPVLIVVENNLYGEFTRIDRHSAVTDIQKRAFAYGIEPYQMDGNDALSLSREMAGIIEKIRSDGLARLVEVRTYRYHGHMKGEPQVYKPKEEQEEFLRKDPIDRLEAQLMDQGVLNEEKKQEMKKEVEERVQEAVRFAKQSKPPESSELLTDVYTPERRELYEGDFIEPVDAEQRSVSEAINIALSQEMERDERVFLWGEDVSLGGYFNVTAGLVEKFGSSRVIDTPISENAIVGGAVGAAMVGMRPVAEIRHKIRQSYHILRAQIDVRRSRTSA